MSKFILLFILSLFITMVIAKNNEIIIINNTIYTDHVYRELYSGKYSIILNRDSKDYVLTFHTNSYDLKIYNWYGKVNFIQLLKNNKMIDKCNGYCVYNEIREQLYLHYAWYDITQYLIPIPIFNPISKYTIIIKLVEPIENNLQFNLTINDNISTSIGMVVLSILSILFNSFFIIMVVRVLYYFICSILQGLKSCINKYDESYDEKIIPDNIDNNSNVINDINNANNTNIIKDINNIYDMNLINNINNKINDNYTKV